jgi:hypothetical protein
MVTRSAGRPRRNGTDRSLAPGPAAARALRSELLDVVRAVALLVGFVLALGWLLGWQVT